MLVPSNGNSTFYKSCPRCSQHSSGRIFYYHLHIDNEGHVNSEDSEFGVTMRRISGNDPYGSQSLCKPCRSGKKRELGPTLQVLERLVPGCVVGTMKKGQFKPE